MLEDCVRHIVTTNRSATIIVVHVTIELFRKHDVVLFLNCLQWCAHCCPRCWRLKVKRIWYSSKLVIYTPTRLFRGHCWVPNSFCILIICMTQKPYWRLYLANKVHTKSFSSSGFKKFLWFAPRSSWKLNGKKIGFNSFQNYFNYCITRSFNTFSTLKRGNHLS